MTIEDLEDRLAALEALVEFKDAEIERLRGELEGKAATIRLQDERILELRPRRST